MQLDGEKLQRARHERGLRQAELAAIAGVRQATISDLERGKPARIGTVKALADALGITPGDLLPNKRHGDPTEAEPPLDASTEHGGRMGG